MGNQSQLLVLFIKPSSRSRGLTPFYIMLKTEIWLAQDVGCRETKKKTILSERWTNTCYANPACQDHGGEINGLPVPGQKSEHAGRQVKTLN